MFACSTFAFGSLDAVPDIAYYDCHVGDSVQSRFCRTRDGRALWNGRKVDYAGSRLTYRLPYLRPHCIYRLRAVFYQTSNSTWRQSLAVDGRTSGSFSYRSKVPETVWVTIPRELYRDDFAVTLDIDRVSGDYATVSELTLYEVYPYLATGGRGEALPVAETRLKLLDVAGANPFRSRVALVYNIPAAQRVMLRVFDIQGRVVKKLVSSRVRPGQHVSHWDGTDELGRKVGAGTYYVVLRTESNGTTRKVVYAP